MAGAPTVLSHWYQLLEGFQDTTPQTFYAAVETAVEGRQLPDTKRSRVTYAEGGMFSAKREYLRVQRREHLFDICGAPFGNGFFVSWWLGEVPSGLLLIFGEIPILGALARSFVRPGSYYLADTAQMFQSAVHSAVLEVVDQMTAAKGVRALSELDRKPVMRDLDRR